MARRSARLRKDVRPFTLGRAPISRVDRHGPTTKDGTLDARVHHLPARDVRGPAFAPHGRFRPGRSDTREGPRAGTSRSPACTSNPGPPAGPIFPGIAGGTEPCDPGGRPALSARPG